MLKLAADRVIRSLKRTTRLNWGGQVIAAEVEQFRYVPHRARPGTKQAKDAALLPFIARLAAQGRIELLWHLDGALEFWGLPDTDSPDGRFFGAPISWVEAPTGGGRIVADARKSMQEHQIDFLSHCQHDRFRQLQLAVGVKEGSDNYANQLLDAFHIWCAEHAQAHYFLTCDYKIGKHLAGHRTYQPLVDVVTPTELLADLRRRRETSYIDSLQARWSAVLARLRARPTSGLEHLAKLGEDLEKQGFYD